MIKIDDKQIKQFEKDLNVFAKRAMPFATQNTVNQMAYKGREFSQQNVRKNMTIRNKWTERSIMFTRTRQLDIKKQEATTGSTADYLEVQEFGGVKVSTGSEGVSIPTSTASGEGDSAKPRKKTVRAANQMRRIRLGRGRSTATSVKQRNFLAIKEAAAGTNKFVFLHLQKHTGIYKVMGGKRKPRIKLIQDMSQKSVRIPANPWLSPAVNQVAKIAPGLYLSALKFQMKRNKLL